MTLDCNSSIRMSHPSSRYITLCDMCFVIFIGVEIILVSFVRGSKVVQFVRELNKVETIIPNTELKVDQKRCKIFKIVILTVFNAIILLDILFWGHVSMKKQGLWVFFKNFFAFYLLYEIIVMHLILNWHMIYSVNAKLRTLNSILEEDLQFCKRTVCNQYGCYRIVHPNDNKSRMNLENMLMEKANYNFSGQ